jgi:hypothetical protein
MSELKTLKDFEFKCHNKGYEDLCSHKGAHEVDSRLLRKEAIKWIKAIESKIQNDNSDMGKLQSIIQAPTIEWIKQFFNISEEDLK